MTMIGDALGWIGMVILIAAVLSLIVAKWK